MEPRKLKRRAPKKSGKFKLKRKVESDSEHLAASEESDEMKDLVPEEDEPSED